jgi:hypothetical protein
MATSGTDQEHWALWGFDVVEWRVKSHQLCICRKWSAVYLQKVIGFSVTCWPIYVGNLHPALAHTWVWCLRHVSVQGQVSWVSWIHCDSHPLCWYFASRYWYKVCASILCKSLFGYTLLQVTSLSTNISYSICLHLVICNWLWKWYHWMVSQCPE